MEKQMVYAICYKTKEPVYYNRGTEWEETEDTFLARYGFATLEKNEEFVAKLNAHDKDALAYCYITPEKLNRIEYFFVNYQEDKLSYD